MAHTTTLTKAHDELHNSQANTYSYSGSFETFKESEVKVKLNDTLLTYNSSPSDATQYSVNLTDKTITVGGDPLSSGTLSIYPETDLGAPTLKAPYTAGSAITASDLTNNQKQTMRKLMEHEEKKLNTTGGTLTGHLTMGEDSNIIFEGATDDAHETTITVADPTADRTITFPNVTGNVVTTGDTGTVTSTMLTNDTIVNADVNSSAAIAGTKINPNFGSQTISTTGNTSLAGTNVAGSLAVTGNIQVDNINLDGNEIQASSGNLTIDSAGGTVTVDDALAVTGGVSLNTTLGVTGTSTLADVTGGAVVTSGTSTSDTKVYSAKRAGEIFYGKDTVEEIQSGETWSAADNKVATTAAIDARIIDLVDDVGGFVPIDNQNSFPQINPDLNNGGGTIVSVQTATTDLTAQSGTTLTLPNGRGTGNAVIITGVSATIPSGFGFLVETTTTDHTYEFHRLIPKATEVTTVAGNTTNINTVATNITNVNNVGNNISNVNTVAGDATEINALAAKTTELGLLGTAAVVEDLGILGTADVVADLNTLGTADVVSDMNTLAVSDVISDMNTLAVSGVISDMDTVATNVTNVNNVGGSIASVNTAAANINSIANFGDQYQVASNNPSTDGGGNALAAGDLYFNTSANELKVYNGSSWQAGVTATGNFALTTGNTFTGDNRYNDGVKALFGTGSDLEIFHNGTTSLIDSVNNHDLIVRAGTSDLYVQGSDVYIGNEGNSEKYIDSHENGAVELYYDNSKKLHTDSFGVIVSGGLALDGDNLQLRIGNSQDLQIYHSGSHSFIDHTNGTGHLVINSSATNNVDIMKAGHSEYMARFKPDNAVELYYDNSKKFETTAVGTTTTGTHSTTELSISSGSGYVGLPDSAKIFIGTGNDLQIYHDGTDSYIENTGKLYIKSSTFVDIRSSGNETMIKAIPNGAVELYYDNSKKFETLSAGASVTGHLGIGTTSPNKSSVDAAVSVNGSSTSIVELCTGDARKGNIYTDGTNMFLTNNSTGYLQLSVKNTETAIKAINDGAVELYYDNSKKFETTSLGAQVTGRLNVSGNFEQDDGVKANWGNSHDLQIYHDGSNSYVNNTGTGLLILQGNGSQAVSIRPVSGETGIAVEPNGAAKLYYDNSKKFETKSDGVLVTGELQADTLDINGNAHIDGTLEITNNLHIQDGDALKLGNSNDFQLYHNNNESWIQNNTGTLNILNDGTTQIKNKDDNELIAQFIQNGSVKLYYDHSEKLYTDNGGVVIKGNLYLSDADNRQLLMGANQDFRIYHDGTYNQIYGTGPHPILFFTNNTQRMVLQNDGHLRPASNDTYDLGTSGDRWRNIYTADLQLSNEGKTNDVDGTWGNYTMQEGENDLFLINNRSGKKYKFNLTEVS